MTEQRRCPTRSEISWHFLGEGERTMLGLSFGFRVLLVTEAVKGVIVWVMELPEATPVRYVFHVIRGSAVLPLAMTWHGSVASEKSALHVFHEEA